MARRVSRRQSSAAPGAGRYREDDDPREEELERDDDDKHYDDERPRRRGRARDDEERPRRGRGRRDEEDDEEERPRGRRGRDRDREEDDDDPIVGSGWDDVKSSGGGDFPTGDDRISLNEDGAFALVRFLEDQPFSVYKRHWLAGRGWTCHERRCPLCEIGDEPTQRAAFNVALLAEGDDRDMDALDPPEVRIYDAAPTVTRDLQKTNNDDRKGPLTAHYWEIRAKKAKGRGGKGFTQHNFSLVKERDLDEDWDIAPLDEADYDELELDLWTREDYPYRGKLSDLEEIAEETMNRDRRGRDDDDDDDRRGGRRRGRRR